MEDTLRTINMTIDIETSNEFLKSGIYIETIDEKKLYALTRSKTALQTDTNWWDDINIDWNFLMDSKKPNEFNFVEKLLRKLKKKDDEYYLETTYMSRDQYGRVYPSGCESLGQMRRPVRHFLCKDLYWDIDIINAHPVILLNLCEAYEYPCDELTHYVNKREEIITNIMEETGMDRDNCKKIIISIMNGGSIRAGLKRGGGKMVIRGQKPNQKKEFDYIQPKWLKKFMKEMKIIQKLLKGKVGDKMYKLLTEGKTFNQIGTFMGRYLQMWEEKFLEYLFNACSQEGFIDPNVAGIILCHDGAMLPKSSFTDISVTEFIDELNITIKEETGFDIKFKSKAFDEADEIEDLLNKEGIKWTDEYVDPYFKKYGIYRHDTPENHDEDLANLYYQNQKSAYRYCDKKLYMLDGFGLYKSCSNKSFADVYVNYMGDFIDNEGCKSIEWDTNYMNRITKQVKKASQIHYEKYMETIPKGKFTEEEWDKKYHCPFNVKFLEGIVGTASKIEGKSKNSCIKKIRNQNTKNSIVGRLVEKYTDDDFKKLLDIDNYLIGFENGVYDTNTHQFRGAIDGEYVSMSCGYDFFQPENASIELLKKVKELKGILRSMFREDEDYNYIMMALSRNIRGDSNKEEIAHFYKGGGSNGKSLLMDLNRNGLGDYYYTLSYQYFTHESKDTRDPALFHSAKKRCIEVGEPNQAFTFISDKFKRASGNDIIKARTNFQERDIAFKMGNLQIPSNHTVKMDSDTNGNSLKRRVVGIGMLMTFHTQEAFNKLSKEEKANPLNKVGDNTLKDKINTGYYNQAFMYLMILNYKKYEKDGLKLTPNFQEDTKSYFANISKEKGWFVTKLKKEKGGRICLRSLRKIYCDENSCSRTSIWFNAKIKEFYGASSVKTNCMGVEYEAYDKASYQYYKGAHPHKVKGMMLDGYIIDPDIFVMEEEEDSSEEEDELDIPKPFIIKKKKIGMKNFTFTSTNGNTGNIKCK